MDIEDTNKPGWKPKFTSEFSMGEYDFKRINDTLVNVDMLSAIVNSTAVPSLDIMQQFFAQLKNLADNFRPIIAVPKVTQEIDDLITTSKNLKRQWERSQKIGININENFIILFVDYLNALKTKLYNIKQVIGLGIVVKRNMSTAEKIRAGVRGMKGGNDNLPEP